MSYSELRAAAEAHLELCDRARAVGVDAVATEATAVDPLAVEKLRAAVERAERGRRS